VRLLRINKLLAIVTMIVLLSLVILYLLPNSQAQTVVSFGPNDQFNIPVTNGTIRFASNGNYTKATLENDTWVFENLHIRSANLTRFKISAQDSNITIFSYTKGNFSNFGNIRLSYAVEGNGKQLINLGLNQSDYTQNVNRQWAVVVTNIGATKNVQNYNYLLEGKDWTLMNDGTFSINGIPGNTTLVRYNYSSGNNSNLPFYLQHSVAITTVATFALVMVALMLIKIKRNNSGET
jgi:hypothetical protein